MLSLRHLMHGNEACNGRRRGPKDRDEKYREGTGSAHQHSLQLSYRSLSISPEAAECSDHNHRVLCALLVSRRRLMSFFGRLELTE